MKKILLSLMLICAFVLVKAQICGSGTITRWDGSGLSGDMGTGQAGTPGNLFTIDGSSADWIQHISGSFAYALVNKGGYEPDPHTGAVAPANVQLDGLRSAVGPDYDRDVPGQDHRDLRYFAFTYDRANVYFYFRRPKNNTAQVALYYFVDINVDGYMKTGEPVIKVTFNNSGSSIEMGYYEAVNSNADAAGSYDATKGNVMSATTTRAKNIPNTSEWSVGSADGWNMPGKYKSLGNNVSLPALQSTNGIMEVFNAQTLTDVHPDGSESGYGVEFAVPFRYLGLYTSSGLTGGTAINYMNVFTWHVSLGGGNSGLDKAEDNAGGCCSGLAVSGAPIVNVSEAAFGEKPGGIPPFDYRLTLKYHENRGLTTKVTTSRITIKDPKDANGIDIPEANVMAYVLTGSIDADCNVATAATSPVNFSYNASLSDAGNHKYVFTPDNATSTIITLDPSGDGCYYIDFGTIPGGWPPIKYANVEYTFATEFDIASQICNETQAGGSAGNLDVLPVKLTYFNAVRNGQNVNLTWQTSSEENSKGFEVQRMTGNGSWQNIGFVSTQAVNGNSGSPLNYQLTDINTSKGITQYRLKQLDIDNRSSYSMIRSVRGDGQKGKTIVYPNPSSDGKINILFEDVNKTRDVQVLDLSGRVVKQMRAVTNNNIQIENLNAGFYTVRIVDNETGEQVVEKFVVNKR